MQAFSSTKALIKTFSKNFLLIPCIYSFYSLASSNDISVNGFYTIDATYAEKNVELIGTAQPSRDLDASDIQFSNSLIGAQLNYQINDNLFLSILGDISLTPRDEVETNISWAYIGYDFGDDLMARVGQLQTPLLKGTELRTIGISRIWARPIIPGNGSSGFNDFVGLDLVKKNSSGQHHWMFQGGIGKAEHEQSQMIDGKSMTYVAAQYQYQDFWLRTALVNAQYEFKTLDERVIDDNASINMLSMESEYAFNSITVNVGGSIGQSDQSPEDSMAYASLNYPLGDITPYVYVSYRAQDVKPLDVEGDDSQQPNDNRPPPPDGDRPPTDGNRPPPPEQPLNRPAPPLDNEIVSWSVGARWFWSESTVVKAQFELLNKDSINNDGVVQNSNKGNLITLTIEGIF
ncbi:MAG: hypothetical protein HWE10_00640 [Gammaproteobacteria bacterium]|nr:hypothetical protein [Gammaproteobacteria bacterium]